MKRIAFYGGSFDPPHLGHLTIAERLTEVFELDEFVFVPAFHAPHKKSRNPTSVFHRYAMLCLATKNAPRLKVSRIELESPERPYSIETVTRLRKELTGTDIFFVIGADSWAEINTWREWERLLSIVNIIVVTRPGHEIGFSHVTEEIRSRIVDSRENQYQNKSEIPNPTPKIEITDAVHMDISATAIRQGIREKRDGWRELVTVDVAKYIEKYDIYNQ